MVTYSTIDHALGSPRSRYFGDGHRGAAYTFTPVEVARGRVRGSCAVGQHGLWSHKEAGVVSRHLSTIDAVSLAGLALESVLELEPVSVPSLVVTGVRIRAGASATDDLTAVPLEATVAWDVTGRVFDCVATVGTMRLGLTVAPVPVTQPLSAPEGAPSYFGEHLRSRTQHLSDIDIDCDAGRMRARLGALAAGAPSTPVYSGLQSAHGELFSISEAIVCLAQLAQTMAYEHDRLSREQSDVFWLRRLDVSLAQPFLRLGRIVEVDVRVAKANVLHIGGEPWRSLRLTAEAPGVNAVADVAHVLPEAPRS